MKIIYMHIYSSENWWGFVSKKGGGVTLLLEYKIQQPASFNDLKYWSDSEDPEI